MPIRGLKLFFPPFLDDILKMQVYTQVHIYLLSEIILIVNIFHRTFSSIFTFWRYECPNICIFICIEYANLAQTIIVFNALYYSVLCLLVEL